MSDNYFQLRAQDKTLKIISDTSLIGKSVKFVGEIGRVRYPASGHKSGDYAIFGFQISKVLKGKLPAEMDIAYPITLKGPAPQLTPRTQYVVEAILVNDPKWGIQYDIKLMRLNENFATIEDQKKFFGFFLTESQVENLFEVLADPMVALENHDIDALIQAKGIGTVMAEKIIERYEDCKDNSTAYIQLEHLGMTKKAIDKLVNRFRSPEVVVEKVLTDPYGLIGEVEGYGWARADKIAQKQGIAGNHPSRIKAYIRCYLAETGDANGHSWINIDTLLSVVQSVCAPLTDEEVVKAVRDLIIPCDLENINIDELNHLPYNEKDKFLIYDKNSREIGLADFFNIERQFADNLHRLQIADTQIKIDMDLAKETIAQTEEEQGFKYTDEQLKVIYNILNNQVSILTGKAGCGKSSSVNAVVKVLRDQGYSIDMCALSGRASSKLTEITGLPSMTIHRLLGVGPDGIKGGFLHTKDFPLKSNLIVLDETSMVSVDILNSLVSAIPSGAKFLMVGDVAQLETIGIGNALKDCMNSGCIPVNYLTKIHRQAARSGIITESLKVSTGQNLISQDFEGVETRGELQDLKIIAFSRNELAQKYIMDEFKNLHDKGVDYNDIQVIVPMKSRGNICTNALNYEIQKLVNGSTRADDQVYEYEDSETGIQYCATYRVNDRIIIVNNNYLSKNTKNELTPIYNGNVGYITSLNDREMIIRLSQQGDVVIPRSNWKDVQLGYAITVHKKQGDSSPYVIFGLDATAYTLFSKELLYTAITRARKYCTIIAHNKSFVQATHISKVKTKQTWLPQLLGKYFNANQNSLELEDF